PSASLGLRRPATWRSRGTPAAPRGSDQERIGAALLSEAPARSVAADETNVVAERQQLLLDRADERRVVAARQVGAPDGAVEQDDADMRQPRRRIVVDDVPRRMAGAMQHQEFVAAEGDELAVREEAVGRAVAH